MNFWLELIRPVNESAKPRMVKEFVRDGKVGESPGKRGRKFKIGPELLDAVAAKQALSQARGVEMGSRSILQNLKAATVGGPLKETTKGQTVNG